VGVWSALHIFSPSHNWPHQQRPWTSIKQVPEPQQRVSSMMSLLSLVGDEAILPVSAILSLVKVQQDDWLQGFARLFPVFCRNDSGSSLSSHQQKSPLHIL